jgi:glycosyltransferase involved in cell wall biosynthesis
LLDDGSSDGTYELATHPKLLVKAKKKRDGFNDLENRNILLKIASFIPAEWLYFIDTDERFDERFETPHQATEQGNDVIRFNLLHLWDDDSSYRVDYPFTRRGIVVLDRMFRNIGHSQILSPKRLHFRAVPYSNQKPMKSRVVLLHHGHKHAEARRRKFKFYTEQDINRDQSSYRHFLDENPVLGKISDFRLD